MKNEITEEALCPSHNLYALTKILPSKALHWTGIPLRSIPASDLGCCAPGTLNL